MKILVVDDNSLVRSTVSRMVADLGHESEVAEDAAAGFARYTDFRPDMIISDWTMPGESGIDLCHGVRESDEGRYTYFAMLTSSGGSERLVAAMQAGADDFLLKPLQADRLEAALLAAKRITSLHARLAASETRSRDLAEEQRAVVRIASAVAAGTDPGAVFADVAREAAHLCAASAGSLWRFQGTEALLAGSWGDEPLPLGATVTPTFDVAGAPVYLLREVWGAVLVSAPADAPLGRKPGIVSLASPNTSRWPFPTPRCAGASRRRVSERSRFRPESATSSKRSGFRTSCSTWPIGRYCPQVIGVMASTPPSPTPESKTQAA